MLTNNVLIDAFERIKKAVHGCVEGLSPKQLTLRPADAANTIAWLVWHLTRIQDDHIADGAGLEQVWTKGSWYDRFGLPFNEDATGYGQSAKDVAAVQADADALLGYFDAVHAQTVKYIGGLKEKDYEKVVDSSYNPPVTLAVRLVSVISDNLQHAGQAAFVRGLL